MQGSIDAMQVLIGKFQDERAKLSVIHTGIGNVTPGDIQMAKLTKGELLLLLLFFSGTRLLVLSTGRGSYFFFALLLRCMYSEYALLLLCIRITQQHVCALRTCTIAAAVLVSVRTCVHTRVHFLPWGFTL